MKNLKHYLNEGLLSRKVSTKTPIRYRPKDRPELIDNIVELLKKGITDLNCIDVFNITDMSYLFGDVNNYIEVKEIDISEWDVSKVFNMAHMFEACEMFNSDLSKWDVSNVQWSTAMFRGCKEFNSDLSKWDVSKLYNMTCMFDRCDTLKKNNKIPTWYT